MPYRPLAHAARRATFWVAQLQEASKLRRIRVKRFAAATCTALKMTKTFAAAATLFAAVELFTCYYLWFDHDGSLFGEGTMAPGNFEGWRLARRSGRKWSSVERQLSFFSLWVGNNKFIFSALLLVCAGSSDGRTRLMASLFTFVGCAIYFAQMSPLLREMEGAGDVREGQADETGTVVGILTVLWLMAFAAELRSFLASDRARPLATKAKQK